MGISLRRVRWSLGPILMAAVIGGCSRARLSEFDALASSAGVERMDITDLPLGEKGSFRLGTATGRVEWRTGSDAMGWGPDGFGPPADQIKIGQVARFGVYAFDLHGGGMPGDWEARCRYGRTETRGRLFALDLATAGRPLRLQCVYRIEGRDAGMLELAAQPSRDAVAEPRQGMIRFDGQTLTLRSDHAVAESRGSTEAPMGYRLTTPDGRLAGVIETNGLRTRRLLLSPDPRLRPAAIAAALSLALFRDPGDID